MSNCKWMSGVNGAAVPLIVSVSEKTLAVVKLLHPRSFLAKKQSNPSNTVVIKVMMILHINIKNWSFNSENSRIKKDMKNHFSGFTQKIYLIYLLWKLELSKFPFNCKDYLTRLFDSQKLHLTVSLFHETSCKQKKFKLRQSAVVAKILNA